MKTTIQLYDGAVAIVKAHTRPNGTRVAFLDVIDPDGDMAMVHIDPQGARLLARSLDMAAAFLDRTDEQQRTECSYCQGRPVRVWITTGRTCPKCQGDGFVTAAVADPNESDPCPNCNGSGCERCGGSGAEADSVGF